MLRGRESLTRLVGKRRRFLPNRETLLSPSPIQSSLNLRTDEDGKIVSTKSSEGSAMAVCGEKDKVESFGGREEHSDMSEKVTCPVCGNKVRGNNFTINSHLDMCLSRGTKRKLTQRTLLQMNFCLPEKVQIHSSKRAQSRSNLLLITGDGRTVGNVVHGLPDFDCFEESDSTSNMSKSVLNLKSALHEDGLSKSSICDDNTDENIVTHFLSENNEVPDDGMAITLDDVSGVILETFIVGRKFSDAKEINFGERISLVRDPHNIKDHNAIKIISVDSSEPKVLGFLPCVLAQYLSPLIEKYFLRFEGQVTLVPKNSLDVVPVQIFCQKAVSDENKENDNLEVFRYLWRNAQQVTESTKNCRTSSTKYQQNFSILIGEFSRSNLHLLIDGEQQFLELFNSLSDDSQRLFVRLYTRKGPWFRMSNIFYSEILDPQKAMKELSAIGYIRSFDDESELHNDDVNDILNLLTVSELREIICILKQRCKCGTRKQELIASLLSSYKDGLCPPLAIMVLKRTGACLRISSKAESLFWRAERLFFLNGEQDLSSFLLADFGIVKYPTYNCIITEPIFSDRNDLLAYEEAIEVAQMIDEALDGNDSELVLRCIKIAEVRITSASEETMETSTSESLFTFRSCFSASWVYSKVLTLGVSFLERERRYDEAIYLLKRLLECFSCGRRRGYWILRLSVDLEHVGYPDESLSVAESGLLDIWVRAGSRMALQRRVLRLGKPPRRWKIPSFATLAKRKINEVHVRGRPLNSVIGMKSRFYGEDGEQCGVEQLALQYYAGKGGGWQGVHTESGIWLTIFGLLMWDVMFSDVPNVFRTRFQTAPLDLETDSFYLARKSSIESHLQKIHDGMAEEIVITSWESHTRTACRGVNWNQHTLFELRAAVACIGGPCLALFCRHLAQDYRSWSSGMPDLLLWRFDGEFEAEAKLVEVKGPRDQLSEQQRAWLLLLMDCGFNTEVCKVSPEPAS
ncbi:fanconi-associated nuclease 1 homolog isoform X1 [Morus notabilis]|uniref:fanconi-associated nuclease 1 homolog isoform X1 n=1 Tax=Morus notabilis TaxID=981085 RepID=UPI000CED30A1|nr:fanconi-associated nuclease 1 homolog isoform X1 [Morus notabilis]